MHPPPINPSLSPNPKPKKKKCFFLKSLSPRTRRISHLSVSNMAETPFLMKISLSFFFFFFVFFGFRLSSVTCLVEDADILIRVKNTQLEDPDVKIGDWTLTGDNAAPCNWSGITCDSQKRTILSIDFTSFGISGGFPSDFCRIRTLKSLNLGDNYFNGSISTESMSSCSHLLYLNLSSNYFVGELPEFLPEFSKLELLDLSLNNFTGEIPVSFGRFPALKVFCLFTNLLNGSIPSFLTNLTELTRFELEGNPFQPGPIPSSIGNLTKLENLWLAYSNLIGPIPNSVGNLISLTNLDLSNNFLSGEIPESIGGLKSIIQIELYDNTLSGELPESLSNLTTLIRFDASQNNLTGKLPASIAGMSLESLFLNDNSMEGEIPETLASNPSLTELKLFNNKFSGELPADLGRKSYLYSFDVSDNEFTGELPRDLCYNKKLQQLVAFNNRFSGHLPVSYGECSSISYIRIANNEIYGEIPERFWSFPTYLELANNRFEGSVSSSISGANSLTNLLIAGNSFSGEFPAEICSLRNLILVDMSSNQFSGELPSCITKLTKLQKLELQDNMFTGEIPQKVSSWTDLTELNLSGNRLSGVIPAALGNLSVLTYLDLSGNVLSGQIPAELAKLKLNKFNISDNELEGKVPNIFNHRFYVSSLIGNPNLCSPDLKPLPRCPKPKPVNIYLIITLTIMSVLLIGSLIWLFKTKSQSFRSSQNRMWKVMSFQRVGFSEEDIFNSLTDNNLIGSGGSGQVYRVKLKTGQTVAVKRLWGGNRKSETETVFRTEVDILGRIRHGNIVKLLFSCSGDDFRFLVYEYMENGSLGDVLHGEKGGGLLDWPKRFAIALGAARGLAYLHHDCVPAILHRDVKSNNILLDDEFYPRVADFGLARTLQNDVEEGEDLMSRIAGSYGYIAPEYGYTLKVTEKSDVYSFGVVLMELVTGKRPNDSSFGENKDIVKWVTEAALLLSSSSSFSEKMTRRNDDEEEEEEENLTASYRYCEDLSQLIDPRMDTSTCDYEEIERVLNVALLCTSSFPMNRPSMRRVVELLKDQKLAHQK